MSVSKREAVDIIMPSLREIIEVLSECTIIRNIERENQVECFYGKTVCDGKYITICYDNLRSEPIGLQFCYSEVTRIQKIVDKVRLWLRGVPFIEGIIQEKCDFPKNIKEFFDLPDTIFDTINNQHEQKVLNFGRLNIDTNIQICNKHKLLFELWGSDILYSTMKIPLAMSLQYVEGVGILVGILDMKNNIFVKTPRYVF